MAKDSDRIGKKQYYNEHKDEILADYKELGNAGVIEKWGMVSSTFTGLKRRWGLPIEKKGGRRIKTTIDNHIPGRYNPAEHENTKLVALFEKVLEQANIERARAYWEGIKTAKGI